jgi:hypothetical protein
MLRIALMIAALLIAAMPAALGMLYNTSFDSETPVRIQDKSSSPTPPVPQRPNPRIDDRAAGGEDRDSGLTKRRQAHNEGDDRAAHRQRPAH